MKYWKRIDDEGNTTTVESYSHKAEVAGAIKITKKEYQAFIAALPVISPEPDPVELWRDEVDRRLANLEVKKT
ncbi:unnamed protein product [marine sediment metagenome]|uniref:Uncharacterized protein n=1 Tax=marine sediment metagenome TaxID=412755 RepID=X1J8N2_9ZZZZ